MVPGIGRAFATHQVHTAIEHIIGIVHRLGAPSAADIDGLQIDTHREHIIHFFHIGGVEGGQVKARKFLAIGEQARHVCGLVGVEMTQVNTRQVTAVIEHIIHKSHLTGVQILEALDGFHPLHAVKPTVGARRAGLGERRVKDHLAHFVIGAIVSPARIVSSLV